MKKIMIAAAIVCAAALSQAAAIKWSTSASPAAKVTCYNGTTVYSQTTYLILASDKDDIAKDLAKGVTSNILSLDTGTGNTVTGAITGKTLDSDALSTASTDFMLLMIDNTYGDNGEYAYKFSAALTKTPSGDSKSPTSVTFVNSSYIANQTWSTYDKPPETTPEPTSGLLLLIGMAGLALKRKRA